MIKPEKYPKLFAIVFGEGMVNDAVAIILFKVVGDIFDHEIKDGTVVILFGLFLSFIINILSSLLIGGACGTSVFIQPLYALSYSRNPSSLQKIQ